MTRWRGQQTRTAIIMAGMTLLAGCQGWGGWMAPVRVPPPATGSYQLPPGYYNNVQPAPTGQPAVGSTTRYEAAPTNPSFQGVQTATYTAPAPQPAASAPVPTGAMPATTVMPASGPHYPTNNSTFGSGTRAADYTTGTGQSIGDASGLQWQQP